VLATMTSSGTLSSVIVLFVFVLSTTTAFDAYNEDFAKNTLLPLSAAAYSVIGPQQCLDDVFAVPAQVNQTFVVICDDDAKKNNTCLAYTALLHSQKIIVVTFRGTKGGSQFLLEGLSTFFGPHVSFYGMGTVAIYFNRGFSRLWSAGLQSNVAALRQDFPDYQIWVTGHSLGAALASLASGAIAKEAGGPLANLNLLTFGQPRVGDLKYSLSHDKLVPNAYRLTHAHDIIVHLPPLNPLTYNHHRQEIFYPGNMTDGSLYKVCKYSEDFSCADGMGGLSLEDHRHYFEIRVPSYCDDTLGVSVAGAAP
jgi:hypothetical protein